MTTPKRKDLEHPTVTTIILPVRWTTAPESDPSPHQLWMGEGPGQGAGGPAGQNSTVRHGLDFSPGGSLYSSHMSHDPPCLSFPICDTGMARVPVPHICAVKMKCF